jgi:hypothetical protein
MRRRNPEGVRAWRELVDAGLAPALLQADRVLVLIRVRALIEPSRIFDKEPQGGCGVSCRQFGHARMHARGASFCWTSEWRQERIKARFRGTFHIPYSASKSHSREDRRED